MPIPVDFPELGTVMFPDGTTPEDIQAAAPDIHRQLLDYREQSVNAQGLKEAGEQMTPFQRVAAGAASFGRGVGEAVGRGVEGLGTLQESILKTVNPHLPPALQQEPATYFSLMGPGGMVAEQIAKRLSPTPPASVAETGRAITRTSEDVFPVEPAAEGFWTTKVPGALGSVVGTIAGAGGNPVGAAVLGGLQGFQSAYERELARQEQAGETPDEAKALLKSGAYGVVTGALMSRFGAGRLAGKLAEGISGAQGFLQSLIKNPIEGAVGMGLQQAAEDLIVDGKPNWQAIRQAGLIGALVQGVLGISFDAINRANVSNAVDAWRSNKPPGTGPDTESLVQDAIANARKNGASPEFRSFFVGTDPEVEGTTAEKVAAFAKSLGMEYNPGKRGGPPAPSAEPAPGEPTPTPPGPPAAPRAPIITPPPAGPLTVGDPVNATLPDGSTVTGVVVGSDPTGNVVVGKADGTTAVLPEKLEGATNDQVQGRVEIPGGQPSGGAPQNAAGQTGGVLTTPGTRPGEAAGLPAKGEGAAGPSVSAPPVAPPVRPPYGPPPAAQPPRLPGVPLTQPPAPPPAPPQPALTEKDVTDLADKLGVPWNYDPAFMAWTKEIAGDTHLSKLNPEGLKIVRDALAAGQRPPPPPAATSPALTPEEQDELSKLIAFKEAAGGKLGKVNAARLDELQAKAPATEPIPPEPQAQPKAGPTPPTGEPGPQPAGEKTAAEQEAEILREREELRRQLHEIMRQMGAFVDPKYLKVVAQLILNYAKQGILKFREFAKRLKADMPEIFAKFRDYLHLAWNDAIDSDSRLEVVKREEAANTIREVEAGEVPKTELTPTDKQAQELKEAQFTALSIAAAKQQGTPLEKYRMQVKLYGQMPTLGVRTAESKVNQAYSTPPPLAFLGALAADTAHATRLLMPTVGNAALAINANPDATILANEIDPARKARAQEMLTQILGAKDVTVTGHDATSPQFLSIARSLQPDRVIENPPFGSRLLANGETERFPIHGGVTAKTSTPSIDLAIMLNTLDTMTPDGRAVFIIGSKTGTPYADFGTPANRAKGYERPEYLELFKRFNVVDMFTIDGKLYSGMGAGWPVDVVVVSGKGETPAPEQGGIQRPWVTPPQVFNSWESLEPKVEAYGSGTVTVPAGGLGGRVPAGGVRPPVLGRQPGGSGGGGRQPGKQPAGGTRPAVGAGGRGEEGGLPEGPAGELGTNLPGGARTGTPATTEGVAPPASEGAAGEGGGGSLQPAGSGLASREKLTTPYVSVSKNIDPKLVVPGNLADAMRFAVLDLEREAGMPVDDFVASKMGWTRDELFKRLSSAQIEAVGLAIRNIERGSALINGSGTGTGKGRTAGGVIDWVRKDTKIPIFVTAKPTLYGDMIGRDMAALGIKDFVPLITNSKFNYVDANGKEIKSNESKKDIFEEIARTGKLPAGYHGIFTTYDQLGNDYEKGFSETEREKRRRKKNRESKPDGWRWAALRKLAPNAVFILDEAHKAAGEDSDVNIKLQDEILPIAAGSYLLSATFSKRSDTLGLYSAATLLRKAGDAEHVVELIREGGTPLYQALSTMLTSAGEFFRVEQNFEGVPVHFVEATPDPEKEVEYADTYTSFLSDLDHLAGQVNAGARMLVNTTNQTRPTRQKVDFSKVTFGGRIFNLSQQYLFALRAETTVQRALKVLNEPAVDASGTPMLDADGKPLRQKPFIAFYNTMEGPIVDLQKRGLPLTFNGILLRQMQKMMEVTIRDPTYMDPGGDHEKDGIRTYVMDPSELPDGGEFYRRLERHIQTTDLSAFPISPVDHIKRKLEQAGVRVTEITGRKGELNEGEEGEEPELTPRERQAREKILRDYNNGEYDAILANGSSAEGVSAHAGPRMVDPAGNVTFNDQRRRFMIIAQPQPDINLMMQMLGRIMRFGQTSIPKFEFLRSSLAAEQRFMAMLRSALSKLNANTSADTESSYTQGGLGEDIFNEIGDQIVHMVLESEPGLVELAGINMPEAEAGEVPNVYDFARKATGRFVLMPNADADRLWKEIADRYRSEIQHLDMMGENPLRASPEDLQAETLETSEFTVGQGDTQFDGPSQLEKVKVKVTHKPMSYAEAKDRADANETDVERRVNEWVAANRAAEQQRLQTATERGNTPDQLQQVRDRFKEARDKVLSALSRIGRVHAFDQTGNGQAQYFVVPYDIRLSGKDVSDLGSASKQDLMLATNTSRPTIPIAVSKAEGEAKYLTEPTGDGRDLFDSTAETSTSRYVVTGNLLSGFDRAKSAKGITTKPRVVMFTRSDGTVHTGILMPTSFDPKRQTSTDQPKIENSDQFARFIQAKIPMAAGEVRVIDGVLSLPANSQFKKIWGNPRFKDFVPYSQQKGGVLVGKVSTDIDSHHDFYQLVEDTGLVWRDISGNKKHSLKPELGPGMAPSDVRAVITQIGGRVPIRVSNEDPPVYNGMRVAGVVEMDGTITMYARALDSPEEVRARVFEELGHLVSRQPEYWPLYRRLLAQITQPEIQAMIDQGYSPEEAPGEALMRRIVAAEQERGAESLFARLWRDFKEWITRLLREWGILKNTDDDIREMVRATTNVGAFPDDAKSYSLKPHTATPVPEPPTTPVGKPANQIFARRSQIEEQMSAEGLKPGQVQTYRDIAKAGSGLIPSESGDTITQWAKSDSASEKTAAHALGQVRNYLDLKNAGEEDIALVPSADGFTVEQISAGERAIPSNQVLYEHENLNRLKTRTGIQLNSAAAELAKAADALEEAKSIGIPRVAASTLAKDALASYEQSLAAQMLTASTNLTADRKQEIARIAQQVQQIKENKGDAIRAALEATARRIPVEVLNGTQWVTDVGGVVPANTAGSVGGVDGVARWIRGQTAAYTPVAGEGVPEWLTTPDANGRLPLSYGHDLLGRLGRIKQIISDEGAASKAITDTREFFAKNTTGKGPESVTPAEFAGRYLKWANQQREAEQTMRALSSNFRSLADRVTGLQMATDELDRIQRSDQYNLSLRHAVATLNASKANTHGITDNGRIYYPTGPLASPQFISDDTRLIDMAPNAEAIDRNTRNAQVMAQAIDGWVNGPGSEMRDPAEKKAWSDQLDWLRSQAMLDASLQWNYAKLGLRPFGLLSRLALALGFPGPPQGIKNLLPGIAQNEFTRTEHRMAQVVTQLDELLRNPAYGQFAVHNAIIEGAKSHQMGERNQSVVQKIAGRIKYSSKAALSDDIYLQYIPQYLSEIFARNESPGDILVGVGSRLSNGELVTQQDMAAVRKTKAYMDRFYAILQGRKGEGSFVENVKEPLRIRDEATNQFRDILRSDQLFRIRRSQSRWGQEFAEKWIEAKAADEKDTVVADDGTQIVPHDNRLALLADHIRVLNDYWMTTNPEFVKSGFNQADAITEKFHRRRAAEQEEGAGTKAGAPDLIYKDVETYLDDVAQAHVDAASEEEPVDFATERAKAEDALVGAFDTYTRRFADQSKAERHENEAASIVSIANNPEGPLTRPRKQMVAPNYFYNYAVATKADFGFLRAKAILPHAAQVVQKLTAIHRSLDAELQRREVEKRDQGGISQAKYPMSLRTLRIATKMVGSELEILETNVAQTARTIYDNEAINLAQRIEESMSMGLLAAVSPTMNNAFTALFGMAFMGTMGGKMSYALRFPLTIANLHKRVLRVLLTGGQNKALAGFINKHRPFFGRMANVLIRALIEEEQRLAEYRSRAGIQEVVGMKERLKAIKANPDSFGDDFGPHRLGGIEVSMNRLLAALEGVIFPENIPLIGGRMIPGLIGIREWTSYIDSKSVPTLGKLFDRELDRMKMAILEAMAKRADGTTPTANWNDPNKPLTPFTPDELGLHSHRELEWYRQQMRPAGSLEFLALRYWNAVQKIEPGAKQLAVPFAAPEEYNSMLREFMRMSGNPMDALNRITRRKPSGSLRLVQQFFQRFQQWSSNYASAINRGLTLDSRDAVKDNALFFASAMMLLFVAIGMSMYWTEEKAELSAVLTGREPAIPRFASVQDFGDAMRYAIASITPTILPYYGEGISRLLGGSSNRPWMDATQAVPALNIAANFGDMVTKTVQSKDPFLPLYDFLRKSVPVTQIPLHLAAQVSPVLQGEERAAAAAAAVRSAAPEDIERVGGGAGGRSGTLTPMSAFVRRAVDYAYANDVLKANDMIEKAVQYQMSRGRDEQAARRIVDASIATRAPTRKVLGRQATEPEVTQLTSRMTGRQQAAYQGAEQAFQTLGTLTGSRQSLVKGQRVAGGGGGGGSLLGGGRATRSIGGRRNPFGRGRGIRSRPISQTRTRARSLASIRKTRSLIA